MVTVEQKQFKRKLCIIAVIVFLLLPVVYQGLKIRYNYIEGDIMHKTEELILNYTLWVLSVLVIYLPFALLITAVFSYKRKTAGTFLFLTVFSFLISHAGAIVNQSINYINFNENIKYFIFAELIGLILDIAITVLILFILGVFLMPNHKKGKIKNPLILIFVITATVLLAANVIREANLTGKILKEIYKESGSYELTRKEWISLIKPYADYLIKGVAGFFIMLTSANILNRRYKKSVESKRED